MAPEAHALGEGDDLEIAGPGNGPGQFSQIQNLAIDGQNNVYSLEGLHYDAKTQSYTGNGRVQEFTNDGKFVRQFGVKNEDLGAASLGSKNNPGRVAVDGSGRVYVTEPDAGQVLEFGPDGTLVKSLTLPHPFAITDWKHDGQDFVAVLEAFREVVPGKGWQNDPATEVDVIDASGNLGTPVPLQQPITSTVAMTADSAGNLYAVADVNQIYKFSPTGKLLKVIGAAANTRNADGSELLHAVAVDSKGNIYSWSWGNPASITMFDPEVTTVTQRAGQFKWADPWSSAGEYAALAIDHNDRLWVAAAEPKDPNSPYLHRYHPVPAVLRAVPDFMKPGDPRVQQRSALLLGLVPQITNALPYSIAYDLQPIPLTFTVQPANRQIEQISVDWRVQDTFGTPSASGHFDLPLQNGVLATSNFNFTPPKFGWYTVTCDLGYQGKKLLSVGNHLGVTPPYAGMIKLAAGDSAGGWGDSPRQMFTGLTNVRLHAPVDRPGKTEFIDGLDKSIALAEKYKADFFVQFSDKDDCSVDNVTRYVQRFKGRVKVWEIMNEPNFTMSPEEYAALVKQDYPVIKAIDPAAQVMGPAHCGISLPWIEATLKAGAGQFLDIISIHDYEGHESIDPVHWTWKYGALRALLAQYGQGGKPLWQTERAITGVRGSGLLPYTQAVRVLLHRNLLEYLGVPPAHNNLYYLNQGGYTAVPSYVWANEGPFPAALALRTRYALTLNRNYAGSLDFGPTGNTLLLGLRYSGGDGTTLVVQNLGSADIPVTYDVTGGAPLLDTVDSYGNRAPVAVTDGKAIIPATQLPLYIELAPGQNAVPEPMMFGRDIALRANFNYEGTSKSDISLLNNGIIESTHAGNPYGGTNGAMIWQGDLPQNDDGTAGPATLDITFPVPRTVNHAIIRSVRADNAFCALLDYDLQAFENGAWTTVESVRTPFRASDLVLNGPSKSDTWLGDNNLFVDTFPTVTSDRFRLIALRETHGFYPDLISNLSGGGKPIIAKLMLREVELYGPPATVHVKASMAQPDKTAGFDVDTVTVAARNNSPEAVTATANLEAPAGWSLSTSQLALSIPAHGSVTGTLTVKPPATIPTGTVPIDVSLKDGAGQTLDIDTLFVKLLPPVSVVPAAPATLNPASQPLIAQVTNLTSSPLSGTANLQLAGPDAPTVPIQNFGPLAPGASAPVEFDVPNLNLSGANWQATYTVQANRLITTAIQQLGVRQWSVIGSFDKDFDKVFGPEENIAHGVDLTKNYSDAMGNELKWRVIASTSAGLLDLAQNLKPNTDATAYAVIYVNSPTARKAIFSTGTDDGGKAWLNGQQIMSDNGTHGATPGAFQLPVQLKQGWNEVDFKIIQTNGGWGCYLDFLGPDNKPMADLAYAPVPGK